MAGEAIYYGTGRRKNAVARVRLVPGTGKVTVNGREAAQYFGREALVDYAMAPFKVTDTMGHFDVIARCNGGGISGQAGALRLRRVTGRKRLYRASTIPDSLQRHSFAACLHHRFFRQEAICLYTVQTAPHSLFAEFFLKHLYHSTERRKNTIQISCRYDIKRVWQRVYPDATQNVL